MTGGLITPEEALVDPQGTAERLRTAEVYGLTDIEVRHAERRRCVIFWLTLEPWADLAAHDYPTERVSITVRPNGYIDAVPHDADRPWLHRNPSLIGELCLQYPNDPRGLRWEPEDGLVAYITIVHRHLQAEECWRRRGFWPAEDAPHGPGPHPVRTLATRRAAAREA